MDRPDFLWRVAAGFPSPADDYKERVLDLNDLVIAEPTATFHLRVRGNSMKDAGIQDGDYIVVDKALEARHNDIIIARLGNRYTVKRLSTEDGKLSLVPANPFYRPIPITEHTDFAVWGVVRAVIHIFIPKR